MARRACSPAVPGPQRSAASSLRPVRRSPAAQAPQLHGVHHLPEVAGAAAHASRCQERWRPSVDQSSSAENGSVGKDCRCGSVVCPRWGRCRRADPGRGRGEPCRPVLPAPLQCGRPQCGALTPEGSSAPPSATSGHGDAGRHTLRTGRRRTGDRPCAGVTGQSTQPGDVHPRHHHHPSLVPFRASATRLHARLVVVRRACIDASEMAHQTHGPTIPATPATRIMTAGWLRCSGLSRSGV